MDILVKNIHPISYLISNFALFSQISVPNFRFTSTN
jgi:hypothetical protein